MLITCGALSTAATAQVSLRPPATERELAGRIVSATAGGLEIETDVAGLKGLRVVGWDRVSFAKGEPASRADVVPFQDLGDRLWRARTRLERSDWLGAFDPLNQIATQLRGRAGPTAVTAFECLLRCESARGARLGSVQAWLELLIVLERSGALTASGIALPPTWIGGTIDAAPVLDPPTALAMGVPPIWIGEPAMDAAAASDTWAELSARAAQSSESSASPRAATMIALIRAASRFEAGLSPELPIQVPGSAEPGGQRLIRLIVTSRVGNPTEREVSRTALAAMTEGEGVGGPGGVGGPWLEAWCRAAIGRSLLRETDAQARMRGVVELMHVPARFSRESPHLTAVSLAESAVALWDLGDRVGARTLKLELIASHPGHPASQWRELDRVKLDGGARSGQSVRAGESAPAAAKREGDQ